MLDEAHKHGLYVTMGIEVARERHGFDYNDEAAVAKQFERIKKEILQYKDHPALIIWAIGNELNLRATNPKVWDAVNQISKYIHEVDPNHLTTTTIAGISKELVDDISLDDSDNVYNSRENTIIQVYKIGFWILLGLNILQLVL